MRNMKAVLFDIYGTLVISGSGDVGTVRKDNSVRSARDAFAAVGLTGLLDDAAGEAATRLTETIGRHHALRRRAGVEHPEVDIRAVWADVIRGLVADGLLEAETDGHGIETLSVEYECRNNPTWLMPGFHDLLGELRRNGLVLGIVSNAQFFTPVVVEALAGTNLPTLGIQPELTVYSYELLEAKPSVSLFSVVRDGLAEIMSIAPESCLYVGNDMLNDVLPAGSCHFRTALFAGDERSYRPRGENPACAAVKPDAVVTNLGQVLELIL